MGKQAESQEAGLAPIRAHYTGSPSICVLFFSGGAAQARSIGQTLLEVPDDFKGFLAVAWDNSTEEEIAEAIEWAKHMERDWY